MFLNPPYGWVHGESSQGVWSHYLINQYHRGITAEAILLINANTGDEWFSSRLWDFTVCLVHRRIAFIDEYGTPQKSPTKSNAFVYFGPTPQRFSEVFARIGKIVPPACLSCGR